VTAPSTPSESQAEASTEGAGPGTSPSASAAASHAAILSVLREYENAYSKASAAAMSSLFTGDVVRHGLQAGGCSTEIGKRAVLDAYESQFSQNGPVQYQLAGLGVGDVQLQEEGKARVETEYSIVAADNSGPIGFALVEPGNGWQIAEVDATCNPGSS
jgi:hypothetical protein